jgi:hypothetical protein
MQHVIKDQSTSRDSYARFFWPILRALALIVALWAFVVDLPVLLYSGKWGTTWLVFAIASFALIAMTPKPETFPAIEGEGAGKARRRLPWTLLIYCGITGLGYNWACAFLWFSHRYALFSGPVIGALTLILVLYVIIGLVVGRLTGGTWRTALLVLALAPCAIGGIVLRLGLLR